MKDDIKFAEDLLNDFFGALAEDNKDRRKRYYAWFNATMQERLEKIKNVLADKTPAKLKLIDYDLEELVETERNFNTLSVAELKNLIDLYKKAIDDVDAHEPTGEDLYACWQEVLYALQDGLNGADVALFAKE